MNRREFTQKRLMTSAWRIRKAPRREKRAAVGRLTGELLQMLTALCDGKKQG